MLGRFGNIPQLIASQQPKGEELIIDKISITLLDDEFLVKKGLDGRHHVLADHNWYFLKNAPPVMFWAILRTSIAFCHKRVCHTPIVLCLLQS